MTRTQKKAIGVHEENKEKVEHLAIKHIMMNVNGRSWMCDLLEELNAYSVPFSPHGDNFTNFNCGKQFAGFRLFDAITTHAPELYLQMMEERKALNDRVQQSDGERRDRDNDLGQR